MIAGSARLQMSSAPEARRADKHVTHCRAHMRKSIIPITLGVLLAVGTATSGTAASNDIGFGGIAGILRNSGVQNVWHVEQSVNISAGWRLEVYYDRHPDIMPGYCQTSVLVLDITQVNGSLKVIDKRAPEHVNAYESCNHPFASSAWGIPSHELEALLRANGVETPWAIDQVVYPSGPQWDIDASYNPRQIAPNICVDSFVMLDAVRKGNGYAVRHVDAGRHGIALRDCASTLEK